MNRLLFTSGIDNGMIPSLQIKVSVLPDSELDCVLMLDEIYLRKGFSCDPARHKIMGFVDLGHLGGRPVPAKHALVFMVRGIYGNWKMPVAYYFTGSLTAEELTGITIDVLQALHVTGLQVRTIVADAAPTNIAMFGKLGASVENPFFVMHGRRIYTMVDPPHLLKAVRNTLFKYTFLFDGKEARWKDIADFYKKDCTFSAQVAPKLTNAHLILSGNAKTRCGSTWQPKSSATRWRQGCISTPLTGFSPSLEQQPLKSSKRWIVYSIHSTG